MLFWLFSFKNRSLVFLFKRFCLLCSLYQLHILMADLFESSVFRTSRLEGAIWGAKLVLLSAGIIATVILFKVAIIPFTFDLILSTLPGLWISFHSWLSPPYIYIILNFIIIIIAASSTRQHQSNNNIKKEASSKNTQIISVENNQNNHFNDLNWQDDDHVLQEEENQVTPTTNSSVESFSSDYGSTQNNDSHDLLQESDQQSQSFEKPISQEEGTLEEAWKLIMDAQGKAGTKQLKKSETWDVPPRLVMVETNLGDKDDSEDQNDPVAWARRELRKADTFSDRVSLRREKSMTQDELNRRAEAFINKVNHEIRLQRQESHLRNMMAMVNRGL